MEIFNRANDPVHQRNEYSRVYGYFTRAGGITGLRAGCDNCSGYPGTGLMGWPDNDLANAGNAGNRSPVLENIQLPRQRHL